MALRLPAVALTEHLMWTRQGAVWATWRLNGLAKGFGNSDTYRWSRLHHQNLFQSVRGEYMILGLTADLDPVSVVNRMLDGVDIEEHPAWALETMLTLDHLAERPLGKREYWLAAPLRAGSMRHRLRTGWRMTEMSARDLLALPQRPPTPQEIKDALQEAGKIEEQIPVAFEPHRATVAEQVWIAAHSQTRGLGLDQAAPDPNVRALGGVAEQYGTPEQTRTTTPAVFPNPFIDEAGQTDLANKISKFDPVARRYLKVQNLREETTSYQVLMALSGSPKGGWETPALDWVGRIDELGVEADWVFRLTVVGGADAARRNKRAEANINDQLEQQEGTAAITGSAGSLVQTAMTLQDYHAALNSSEKEVEVQASILFAVGGPTVEEAKSRAQFLAQDFKGIDFVIDTPLGGQEALWWAMHPGVPSSRQVKEFIEITTGADFAKMVPLSSSDLGDNKGIMLGGNITSGTERPVLLDLEGQIRANVSGSIGLVGEQGGGKSTAMKIILGAVHDCGGKIIIIDRTQTREYATFAHSLDPKQTVVVDITEPEVSLDPLRMFGPRAGATHVQTLLSAMLGYAAQSDEGATLAEVLDPEYAEANGLHDMQLLHAHLQELGKTDDEARSIAKRMGLYVGKQFGKVLFDGSLPPLDLDIRGIAFLTHGVSLPTARELDNPKMFDRMGVDKVFGRAIYALITSVSRHICFSDASELTLFAADEVHHITMSPEGDQEMDWWYRDGRKHKAPVLVASQDAISLGSSRGQIKNRLVFRSTDEEAAKVNLEWFHKGLGDDREMIRLVTEDLSPLASDGQVPLERRGEGIYRDARRRMGKIRVSLPHTPERREAVLSTPAAAKSKVAAS